MNKITISIATVKDIQGMIAVRHDTWLSTYPNQEHCITVEDLQEKLKEMHNGEEERWASRIENDPLEWLGNGKVIVLEVASYNTKAINFYKSYGFVEAGKTSNPGKLPNGKIVPETLMIKK